MTRVDINENNQSSNNEILSLTHKKNYIHTIITKKLTLVGLVGPCCANKEAQRNLWNGELYQTHQFHKL
jgi:hypothetical protein